MRDPMANLSAENRAALQAELRDGERLDWAAEPSRGMRAAGCVYLVFAFPFTGFGLFWLFGMGMAIAFDPAPFKAGVLVALLPLFGLPFLAVGLYLFCKPWLIRREASKTIYAFTDQRLLRIVHVRGRQVSTVPLDRLGAVDVQAYSDGSGTITLQTYGPADDDQPGAVITYQLLGVRDVATARALLEARSPS